MSNRSKELTGHYLQYFNLFSARQTFLRWERALGWIFSPDFCLSFSDLAWTPLDLVSLITEHIPIKQEMVFWKALLVLPSDDEYSKDDPNRYIEELVAGSLSQRGQTSFI